MFGRGRPPEPLLQTLRALCASRPLVTLAVCFGPAIGAMNGVATLLGQMLCTTGYSAVSHGGGGQSRRRRSVTAAVSHGGLRTGWERAL